MPNPRAGDHVIAIDREVAQALALLCHSGESPNAMLRRWLDLPVLANTRHSKWRLRYLPQENKYSREVH